ncbi:MAG: hypothetical protein NUV82_00135 [Candidatus Komeilibacteria bacterium]|nr:hypothetical protein [Candidatus Komeilibacteria bacterium]
MSNWLQLEYLFSRSLPPIEAEVFNMGIGLYLIIFVAAVVFALLRKKKNILNLYRRLWQKLSNWSFAFSIVGLLLLFFRHQMIPYLGMRGWTLIWWVFSLLWLLYILKYWLIEVPRQKEMLEARENFDKYLP